MDTSPFRTWLAGAAHRYSTREALLYAACAWAGARMPDLSAVDLYYAQKIVLKNDAFSLSSVRAAVARLAAERGSVHSLPALARAARRVVALAVVPHLGVGQRRQEIVRRAIVAIGLTWVAEAARRETMTHVIVSSRWLASQLGTSQQNALNVINILKREGILVGEKKLRDGRTRAYRLRSLYRPERIAGELAWASDADELVAWVTQGKAPTAGSLADVLASAGSPVWTHPNAAVHGAWLTAVRDAMTPRAREARQIARELRDPKEATRRRRALASDLDLLLAWPKMIGAPARPAAARSWLAERLADRPMVEWLAEVAEESGAAAAADERKAAAAAARRANRRAADAATGGGRSYRTPEETAVAMLQRVGDRPADLDEARVWLGQVADAWERIGDRATLAQKAAMREAVRRVLVGAGMADERAQVAADRVTGARREERMAA
ncbi:hypothetical protein [Leucobacter aridicollis]|uniref:Ribosomal protein L12E/L44/L45/RPP1/RPP2 n=1 Tax=Leucobacter aridicollis TaxID=283878 RepID=A0A852R2P8_9MICO|nr:hypothetical protein [Leucobacter aridicollis]MBL3682016.1 hypothetical protein [Leucobacter aridicollis]NYD26937.1 ribosomal protein L12E/L44/L45/RPP1/RPP2 [Leucobacter aridicollis]